MAGRWVGSPSSVQRGRLITRDPAPGADDYASLFLSETEVQAVADAHPVALRALFLPDFDGVATSLARLLRGVVQRCKWNGQVDGRVLHACEALGLCQGRFVPTILLAKRLRGFSLAWHSFTLEECEAFVEVELDADEDGQVTVQDIFEFLHNWQLQAQRAQRVSSDRSSRPSALVGGSTLASQRRREARRQTGLVATGKFPRGLREKLLAAARQARSRGENVLRMLRVASPDGLEGDRNEKGSPSIGAEGACRFLRQLGVDCDSSATATRASGGSACALQGERACYLHQERTQELDTTRGPNHSREGISCLRPREHFHRGRSMYIPLSRQHCWGGCADKHNLNRAGTPSSYAGPWSAGCEQSPTAGARPLSDARTTGSTKYTTARLVPEGSNPSDSPMLPSKSKWVVHGEGDPRHHHKGVDSASEETKGVNDVDVDEDRRTSSTRKGSGTGMSQRLRRAAEDLKRMQTEYKELQTQVYGRREERPSAPPEANAQPTDDHTGEEVGRFSYHTTSRSPYHRPSSFQHGHRNLRHDDTNYFEKKQQSSPDFQGGGRKHGEKWETDKEQTVKSSPIPLSSSGEETKNSPDAARRRQHAPRTSRYRRYARSTAEEISSAGARAGVSGWPRHGPDTCRCRALLLLAALGKSSREETFDVATARNGFSGIQPCDVGGATKVCRTPKPRGRWRRTSVSNGHWRRATDVKRGLAGPGLRGTGAAATTSNASFPRPAAQGVHPFLASAGVRRSNTRGHGIVTGGVNEEEGARRDGMDHTPERRPIRPKAIKSPMYARRGRSEERNVWDRRSGRWARPRPHSGGCVRSRSADHLAALERHRRSGGGEIVRQ